MLWVEPISLKKKKVYNNTCLLLNANIFVLIEIHLAECMWFCGFVTTAT